MKTKMNNPDHQQKKVVKTEGPEKSGHVDSKRQHLEQQRQI